MSNTDIRETIQKLDKINEGLGIDQSLEKIAQSILGIETLETRNSDRLDFHEVAVWQIKKALRAAYMLGADDKAI